VLIEYVPKQFREEALGIIEKANEICVEYQAQGYNLTLRQLYYQFVARALIANKDSEYKRLGSIVNDARLAGLLDWNHIEDRTRNLMSNSHWATPEGILRSAAHSFRLDKWDNQVWRLEVWVEKEALAGIVEKASRALDVAYFACRGYVSQSEMHVAAMRMRAYEDDGCLTKILHLGDHDPSGIDMTRDIQERLHLFGAETEVVRIALNMDQVRLYNPPPNPAKLTDSRCTKYLEEYGDESWELDALDPATLEKLIRSHIAIHVDKEQLKEVLDREESYISRLLKVADDFREDTDDDGH
jgi:hypothetical protein